MAKDLRETKTQSTTRDAKTVEVPLSPDFSRYICKEYSGVVLLNSLFVWL